jgi:hypothetical protein
MATCTEPYGFLPCCDSIGGSFFLCAAYAFLIKQGLHSISKGASHTCLSKSILPVPSHDVKSVDFAGIVYLHDARCLSNSVFKGMSWTFVLTLITFCTPWCSYNLVHCHRGISLLVCSSYYPFRISTWNNRISLSSGVHRHSFWLQQCPHFSLGINSIEKMQWCTPGSQ